MALNLLMHPRNPYRDRRPDFKALAAKYETFKEHVKADAKGKVHVDFKNPACLRALTWALLKDDFQLDVVLPLDRLIPTIPLRLNYILWLEDIFDKSSSKPLKGIDIGTGAASIYPLLGAKTRGWHFIATEADPTNTEYAIKNVARNGLCDHIRVVQVNEDTTLSDVICKVSDDGSLNYDFCMCNPPFYGSNLEAWGWLTTRGIGPDGQGDRTRSEPSSVSTASPVECIAPGGEVQFVQQRIIESSLELKSRFRVYTTMLGKKTSVSALKDILRANEITNIGVTEFCQGKTMRWGLAWSFDSSVVFPKPVSKVMKAQKPRPPLVCRLPSKFNNTALCAELIENIFRDLQITYVAATNLDDKKPVAGVSWIIESLSNTWSHQRRKRRQQVRGQQPVLDIEENLDCKSDLNSTNSDSETVTKQIRLQPCTNVCEERTAVCEKFANQSDSTICSEEGRTIVANGCDESCRKDCARDDAFVRKTDGLSSDGSIAAGCFLKSEIAIRTIDDEVVLEFRWIDGQNRELLHQLLQYFKNKLV